ncbi:MAG: CRISPR-associated protein Cas4 [Candidatus Anammoxibacter sp.]
MNTAETQGVYITPSEVMEFLYCPRFIYFMNCLCIPQHEEQRYKVLKGRELHDERKKINKEYIRKKLRCIGKDIDVYMSSDKLCLKGVVDEVLFLEDGTLAPLDYKFAEYKDTLFKTHKYQSILYAMLIKENYRPESLVRISDNKPIDKIEVNKGFVCYIRSKNVIKEIKYSEKDFATAKSMILEILNIIQDNYYPKKTRYLSKCIDCCYRNICV